MNIYVDLVFYESKCSIFGFWSICWTKQGICALDIFHNFLTLLTKTTN